MTQPAAPLAPKAYWPPAFIFLQSVLVALAVVYMTRGFYEDDAYISLRYAQNLLDGFGLTWNPGERVEGYTNFLFVILLSVMGFFHVDLVWASRIINFAAYGGLIWTIHSYTNVFYRKHFAQSAYHYAHRISGALAVGLIISSAYLLIWCVGGLESPLFAWLITLGTCGTLKILDGEAPSPKACAAIGISFALAALTRPEGAFFFAYSGGFLGLLWLLPATRKRTLLTFRALATIATTFFVIFIPYMLWRFNYYGDWLPNTYYAKLDGLTFEILWPRGLFYLLQFVFYPPMLTLFSIAMVWLVWRFKKINLTIVYLTIYCAWFLYYIVSIGGDHMRYLRFMVPAVPLMTLLVYHCSAIIIETKEKWFRDISGALLFFTIFQFGYVVIDEGYSEGAISGLAVVPYVSEHWPEGTTIAINPVGAMPYMLPKYTYIDMLGLLTPEVARRPFTQKELDFASLRPVGHMKGNGAYVLSRKPDYIILGHVWGNNSVYLLSDIEIRDDPTFKRDYKRVETYITPPPQLIAQMHRMYEESAEINRIRPEYERQPILNDKNQLRFIYYQRKK